ncbi:transmembrane protein 192 [Leptonychotes weddellii]|uniref:Transmembrane protein 192 n=1 Tax=Leptonychotes weddellii TaxID=9713 RepID=A0A7F8QKR5_LEPWE|nr:transmembrane protein 192 [Leptonychotes weddellii]
MFPLRLNAEVDSESPEEMDLLSQKKRKEIHVGKTTDILYRFDVVINSVSEEIIWIQELSFTFHMEMSGSTALLLVLCVQHSFPEPSRLYLDLILAILALELICSLTCLLVYTVKIRKFNKAKPQPDVLEEEKIYAYPSNITSETGFRTISSLEDIVEKQGDIIAYLKRHNALLSKRLLTFTSSDLDSPPSRA